MREDGRIKASRNGAAADEGKAKAHALFFRECDDFESEGKTECICGRDQFEGQYNAENAIEGACVGDGVNVRAKNEALGSRDVSRLPESAKIADGIYAHGHSEAFHACTQVLMNLVNRRGEKAARDAARFLGHGCDEAAFLNGSSCAIAHWRTSSLPRGLPMHCPEWKTCSPRSQVSCTRPRSFVPR